MFSSKSSFLFSNCLNNPKPSSSNFQLKIINKKTKENIQKQKISLKKYKILKNSSTISFNPEKIMPSASRQQLKFNRTKHSKRPSIFNSKGPQIHKNQRLPYERARFYIKQMRQQIHNDLQTKIREKRQIVSPYINYNSFNYQQKSLNNNTRKSYVQLPKIQNQKKYQNIQEQKYAAFKQKKGMYQSMNQLSFNKFRLQTLVSQKQLKSSQKLEKITIQKQNTYNSTVIPKEIPVSQQLKCQKICSLKTKQSLQQCKTTNPSQSVLLDKSIKSDQTNRDFSVLLSEIIQTKNQTQSILNSYNDQHIEQKQIVEQLFLPKAPMKKSPFVKTSAFHQIHLNNPQINQIRQTLSVRSDVTQTEYSFVIE